MPRSRFHVAGLLVGVALLASCSDGSRTSGPAPDVAPLYAISDGARGGQAEFFWLRPSVATTPATSGVFDAGALAQLAVEVCVLDAGGACAGPPIERFTSTSSMIPSRPRLVASQQFYELHWITGVSKVSPGTAYRVTVLRSGTALGWLDVQVVRNAAALSTVDTQQFTGLVAGQQFAIRFRLERPEPRHYVRVNEVESNLGAPGDWIELHNAFTRPLDVSGYVVRDNDDTRGYVLPASSVIPANGFLVVEEAQLGFGLGGADQARLFAPDGATLVDSYAWTTHASTTYGRCPDGSGAFAATSIVTKGAVNDCAPLVRLNEIESNGGTPADWVELHNPNAQLVSLAGYVLRDATGNQHVLPEGTSIAAGGFLVLEQAQLGFELDAADEVRLLRPNGTALVDSHAWTSHAATTLGRCPDGVGAFVGAFRATKGTANDCATPTTAVKVNEVESSGGTPGDWVELFNAGASAVDLSGYVFRDNNDAAGYVIPSGTTIAAGGYLVLDEVVGGVGNFAFGLGQPDMARLFAPGGTTLVDSYGWTTHSTTTYGRCANGTGAFTITGAPTKGAANNCGALALAVKVNEVESNGGVPGDWVELYNTGGTAADLSGYVFRDNAATGGYVVPNGTVIAAGGYLVLDEVVAGAGHFAFGLGASDQARLLAPDGVTLIDQHTWTAHATTTYGRCPNGTGDFATTTTATKGAPNDCAAGPTYDAWPGGAAISAADAGGSLFGGNMSGLSYEPSGGATPGVLWAARNGPGALFRLVWDGAVWVRDTQDDWGSGKLLRYPDGAGDVDAEGVARVGPAIYVAAERNNAINGISRNSILLFDPGAAGTTLTAVREWNVTADIPATGANLGLEAITFVPDAYLVGRGFRDEARNAPYDPSFYANHEGGLFLVGVEQTGAIHAYALDHVVGTFTRVATIASGFVGVMELHFDREQEQLWAVCDNGCEGRSHVLDVDTGAGSPTLGRFAIAQRVNRPSGMPNLNNEGFAVAAQAECVGGVKPAFWADDSQTGGVSLRRGSVSCAAAPSMLADRSYFP